MKLSHSLCLIAAGLTFVACSDDKSDGPVIDDGKAIVFNASAPLAPRAVVTTQTLDNFKVWAFVEGAPFMKDVSVSKVDGSWKYNPVMYWPADQSVNFFSYSPAIKTETPTDESNPDIPGFINFGATDLLYGVNIGENGATSNQVKINFRHALAQVRFLLKRKPASASQPALRVDVKEIRMINVDTVGDFEFPRASTAETSNTVGEWKNVRSAGNPVIYSGNAVSLTDDPREFNSRTYFFSIPQELEKSDLGGTSRKGSFVRVLCSVYDEASDVKLWPSSSNPDYDSATGCGYLYFPLDGNSDQTVRWDMGRGYVYTLEIGVPSSSAAIQFDITVDRYENYFYDI